MDESPSNASNASNAIERHAAPPRIHEACRSFAEGFFGDFSAERVLSTCWLLANDYAELVCEKKICNMSIPSHLPHWHTTTLYS